PLNVGPMDRGWRTGSAPANALYRADGDDGSVFTNNDQELRIYLSGFFDGTDGSGGQLFPGWHANVPDIAEATSFDVKQNPNITDESGSNNPVDYTIDLDGVGTDVIDDPDGATPGPNETADWLNAWDVDPPRFSSFDVNFDEDPNETTFYEIVSRATTVTSLVNRIEFHVLDNSALDYSNASDQGDNPTSDGVWDPQDIEGTAPSDLTHSNDRANEGVRDTTLDYPGDGLNEIEAFEIQEVGVSPPTNTYNQGFSSNVDNSQFGNVTLDDDSYFTLNIDDSGHGWGLLNDLYVVYDAADARITDLAGNLLPSATTPLALIERTPPRIELSLTVPETNRIYVRFSEPVWADDAQSTDIDGSEFTLNESTNSITGLETISRDSVGGGPQGQVEVFLELQDPVDPNSLIAADIEPAADSVFDKAGNPMPTNIDRRISDVGINLVDPIWASDGIETDDSGPGGPGAIRDFAGGEVLTDRDIRLQARIVPSDYQDFPLTLIYDIDVPEEKRNGEFWSPSVLPGLIETGMENDDARIVDAHESQDALRTFLIPEDDPELESGVDLEFLFRIGNLEVARVVDESDPLSLAPWKFGIRGVVRQRAGVTILNNVINPREGERTILQYELEEAGLVRINVFSLDGNLVRRLHTGRQGEGSYTVPWDGTNASGQPVARGIYFIRVMAPGVDEYRKVMVVK
ncbi:MAG: FlgD immunoglobulin-like domain containing protein, partial [Rhodothermales bacterium]